MKIFKSIVTALLISSSTVFAHGENHPGPNGGEVRMPGAFHTEVVSSGPQTVKVYLLDMKFQSPTNSDSSVFMTFKGRNTSEAKCEKQNEYFICSFDESVLNSSGHLFLNAVRENKQGRIVKYVTPLKYKG